MMKPITWSICALLLVGAAARAQEPARVQVTIKVPAKTPSFTSHRLVVMLYHDHPTQQDRGKTAVARHIDAKFSHEEGKETVVTVTIGKDTKRKWGVNYTLSVTVFDASDKNTHFSEKDGDKGPFDVLSSDSTSRITVLLRPMP